MFLEFLEGYLSVKKAPVWSGTQVGFKSLLECPGGFGSFRSQGHRIDNQNIIKNENQEEKKKEK